MKAYLCTYAISGIWLLIVFSFLSDYHWYQLIAAGTWGFVLVNAVTLLPVILCLFIADRLQPAKKESKPQ
ncbi:MULTISPECIES: hypothetical protein [Bacillales]|uniref:hypothetical protein n=1 Tax=Bacillales TaxID=1385 RepID=UPI0006A767D0|nr:MULTISPECIES: hypothetical protein [Bacillales]OBZ13766.1 hypothetical protein A7975_13230 [Bacillus sp. FJAT-26390]